MADDNVAPIRKALDPLTDGSGWGRMPMLAAGLQFRDYGSLGLRQFGGWVREEFLPDLVGRTAARTYREMMDNSSAVGSMLFTIQQSMRKMEWRCEPADDTPEANKYAEFVDSLREDMSHTWNDFMIDALSMLGYGYSIHEIVYKRRLGRQAVEADEDGNVDILPSSKYDDGLIGWRRLPIRGQDTVLKWFFDANGQVIGVTQQPWVGQLIDIPIKKFLLFRPFIHKNNPEGRSILRTAYRSWYLVKRLEEMEAILFERMGGLPVIYVPSSLIDAASADGPGADAGAKATFEQYKKIVANVRVDEQMGLILPSDPYVDPEGKISGLRMYEFKLEVPRLGRGAVSTDQVISRHKLDMLMTVLVDFLMMGHDVRGAQSLAVTKVDLFNQAIEGWLSGVAEVFNRHALPRLWRMNGFDEDVMPHFVTEMPRRLDMDAMGWLVRNLAQAGMPLFPDEELENYIRDASGMPEIEPGQGTAVPLHVQQAQLQQQTQAQGAAQQQGMSNPETVKRWLLGAVAQEIKKMKRASVAQ